MALNSLHKKSSKNESPYRNRYVIMRHGQGMTNLLHIVSRDGLYPLTPEGREQAGETARRLSRKKIDMVVSSPVPRAKETAEIVAAYIGVPKISIDPHFTEIGFGVFEGKSVDEWKAFFLSRAERLTKQIPKGESFVGVRRRMVRGFMRLEEKYRDKNILIVSHDDPLWLLYTAILRIPNKKALAICMSREPKSGMFLDFAQAIDLL